MKSLSIRVDGREIKIPDSKVRLDKLAEMLKDDYQGHICMAKIKNKYHDLNYVIHTDEDVHLVDTTSEDGRRLYFRVLSFLLVVACRDVFDNCKVFIKHSIAGGLYCTLRMPKDLTDGDVEVLKAKMQEYIDKDYKITCHYMPNDQAIDKFEEVKRFDKSNLLKYRDDDLTKVYECNGYFDYFYGHMFPSTSYIKDFDLVRMGDGLVIQGPDKGIRGKMSKFKALPKLSDIYRESEQWSRTLGIETVVDLNEIIENKEYGEMIRTVEALHEKKIAEIADMIVQRNSKLILIAAPSSSGKTSFAHRLSTQLRVNGLTPLPISLDDYFVDREHTPKDENGEYDFESIDAIDIDQFNKDLNDLLNGKEIVKIKFDFMTGSRVYTDKKLKLEENHPIILEGIHGLNPNLTKAISDDLKFKIYLSVITQINLDDHNRIPTTDFRLIRRMVRDHQFRNSSAERTLEKWASVRRGEERNIFPYQEEADVMFNSASVYELSVLKPRTIKLLRQVDEDSNHYLDALRLRKFLQYFNQIDDTGDIGPTSIIREFIGGSRIVD
ncbi:ATPase AAA [Peptostreptococcus sp. MV1]|uniref:nucleoside kinase n=1 Tax=Peptostreptococcus sp. MV1 TaxID=1219626 RepID=UPI00050F42FF|nr:nucleoside kinase [Peptostreptococcus sp. MV1]KGF12097.1 ATPase AAA [Peptostreptococcus sp. MV1]